MLAATLRITILMVLVAGACSSSSTSECEPAPFAAGPPNTDGKATTSDNIEVWGLFYPSDLQSVDPGDPIVISLGDVWGSGDTEPRRGTKIVWRATGQGEFSVDARGPGGSLAEPFFQEEHLGSMWARPGNEWGTLWEFPEPGCWTFRVARGEDVAHISVEVQDD